MLGLVCLVLSFVVYLQGFQPLVALTIWLTGGICTQVLLPHLGVTRSFRLGRQKSANPS
jgi:hypothetical protein